MPFKSIQSLIEALSAPVMLAVIGGLAKIAKNGATSWRQCLSCIILSGFTGVIISLLLDDLTFSPSVKAAIIAISGYSGGAILDALVERVVKGVEALPGPGQKKD